MWRYGRRSIQVLIVAALLDGFPLAAQQADVDNTAGVFAGADALFHSTDGCIESRTAIDVFTIQGSVSGGTLFFSLVAYDECTGAYYLGADSATAVTVDQLKVNASAGTARLVADVPAGNPFTGATRTVHIDVTWNAGAPLLPPQGTFVFTDNAPRLGNFVVQTNGTLLPATPSGAISDGVVSFSADPAPVGSLDLARAAFHSLSLR